MPCLPLLVLLISIFVELVKFLQLLFGHGKLGGDRITTDFNVIDVGRFRQVERQRILIVKSGDHFVRHNDFLSDGIRRNLCGCYHTIFKREVQKATVV